MPSEPVSSQSISNSARRGGHAAATPRASYHLVETTHHGMSRVDPFAWLRSAVWQQVMRDPTSLEPEIRAYLEAENAYADEALASTVALQEALFAEMRGRIKEDDSTVPSKDGAFAYSVRFREGGQHPLICRQPREGGDEQVLLDGDAVAAGKAYFNLGGSHHSPDHKLLAWSADEAGAEFYSIRLRIVEAGTELTDLIPDSTGQVVWTADSNSFYYVRLDQNHRPSRVFRHRVGTTIEEDVLVYSEEDPGFFVAIGDTPSRRHAEISAHDHNTSESWLVDLHDPDAQPVLVAMRDTGVQYDVSDHPSLFGGPALILRTNADGAEDFKICWTAADAPGRADWRDIVPHRPGVYVLSALVFANWLIRLEREDGLPRIVVRALASGEEYTIDFAEEAYSLSIQGGFEFETDTLRFVYSSMTTPAEVFDFDLARRQRSLRKRQIIPSGHDPAAYVTRRIFARASDGESVPVSLLYRRDVPQDGTAPCLLYGYGAYGLSVPASFGSERFSLVDRGFIYAIAHVRGGTERGWRWYREGKLGKKTNTFNDFIAAAEHLLAEKWVRPRGIIAQGGSAGGMLIGAVANMRPDLFGGLIAEVPFVDVLNTMLDDTLPLTPPEWPEWGNPIADPEAFKTIRAYCPYDNVRAQDYPPLLVLAGLSDPRVTYWEPAKWVAKLRSVKTDGNMLVFRVNMDAGHGGAAGRFDRLKEVALAYAFALHVTNGEARV